jgi:hypothetical protein
MAVDAAHQVCAGDAHDQTYLRKGGRSRALDDLVKGVN